MSNPVGRPAEPIREAWAMRFGLNFDHARMRLTDELLWQLARCRNDEARRIILGVNDRLATACVRGAEIVQRKREQMRKENS